MHRTYPRVGPNLALGRRVVCSLNVDWTSVAVSLTTCFFMDSHQLPIHKQRYKRQQPVATMTTGCRQEGLVIAKPMAKDRVRTTTRGNGSDDQSVSQKGGSFHTGSVLQARVMRTDSRSFTPPLFALRRTPTLKFPSYTSPLRKAYTPSPFFLPATYLPLYTSPFFKRRI